MTQERIWEEHIDKTAEKILSFLETKQGTERVYAKYTLKVILSECEKLVLLSIIFAGVGHAVSYLYALITIIFLRMFTGGVHRKSVFGCFLHSFVAFAIIIFMGETYILGENVTYVILGWMSLLIVLVAPIQSANRIHYNQKQRLRFKCKEICVVLVILLLHKIVSAGYYNIMLYAVCMHVLELTYLSVRVCGERRKEICRN